MGASSRYTSVPQSEAAAAAGPLDLERAANVRARDFLAVDGGGRDKAAAAAAAALDVEEEEEGFFFGPGTRRSTPSSSTYTVVKRALLLAVLVTGALALGFCAGSKHQQRKGCSSALSSVGGGHGQQQWGEEEASGGGLLPPQSLVPDIPMKGVTFGFPTPYEDTSVEGDKLWDALMPMGSGFIRVPYPRRYDMPASKVIEDDPEDAEIYSLSSLHQIHCLAVIRDVIKHYQSPAFAEVGPSRFVGNGHEWHCVDYIRQGIMCAADTTLDFAEAAHVGADGGTVSKSRGFTGNNSTHQCRDWDAMVGWAVENRAGDRKSIA